MKIKLIKELEKKNNNLHNILKREKIYINKFECIKVFDKNYSRYSKNIIQLKKWIFSFMFR
jgi:hypothetical protein